MTILILDTETTGLLLPSSAPIDEQPRIIELGALKLNQNGEVIGKINELINPGVEISEQITNLTGITNERVKFAPRFCHLILLLKDFFSDVKTIICHNSTFDITMLQIELYRCGFKGFNIPNDIICTAQEYTTKFNKRPSLKFLYQSIVGVPLKQSHRALDDAIALHQVLAADRFFDKLK